MGQLSGEGIAVPVLCFILLFLDFGVFCPMYCLSGEKNNKLCKEKKSTMLDLAVQKEALSNQIISYCILCIVSVYILHETRILCKHIRNKVL